jgi:hypothetical protein
MEHNSNLFGDASFLAVPAIHFFGFPGYYTSTPPRLPAYLFENPERRARLREQLKEDTTMSQPWLCSCLAKSDPHHLDVTFCRQEHSVEDITIRFSEAPAEAKDSANGNGTNSVASADAPTTSLYSDLASDRTEETTQSVSEARREAANFPSRKAGKEEAKPTAPTAPQDVDAVKNDKPLEDFQTVNM